MSEGLFSSTGTADKRRRAQILRNQQFEDYFKGQLDLLSKSQQLALPRRLTGGANTQRLILTRHLDTKFALLNHLGISTVTIAFDSAGMKYADFKKAMSMFISEEKTLEADEAIKRHKFFVLNPRAMASWMVASSMHFDSELYRPAVKRRKHGNADGGALMSTAQHIEANKAVLKRLFKFLVAADSLPQQLEMANLDFSQFVILGKLYFTSKPLSSFELVTKTLKGKAIGKKPAGNYAGKIKEMVEMKLVQPHHLENKVYYTITGAGTRVFCEVLSGLYDKATDD